MWSASFLYTMFVSSQFCFGLYKMFDVVLGVVDVGSDDDEEEVEEDDDEEEEEDDATEAAGPGSVSLAKILYG